ncbi:MAG: polyphosphate kinase 1 [Pseudomonadales bacterium]
MNKVPPKLTVVDEVKTKSRRVPSLDSPELYLNQEYSRLKFNERVLIQATNPDVPLLERLRFLLIFASNMDEFFEIRLAGQKSQIEFGRENTGPDGNSPREVLKELHRRCHVITDRQHQIWNEILLPELAMADVRFLNIENWTEQQSAWLKKYFKNEVAPVISPLGLDPAHPFPRLVNKSLNFILSLSGKDAFDRESGLAIVPVPRSLPRIIKVPEELSGQGDHFIFLSSIIRAHVGELFPGMTVNECHQFRVIRNSDLDIIDAEVEDIAHALRGELSSRRFGSAVKLEVAHECPEALSDYLLQRFNLGEEELYKINGPVNLQRLLETLNLLDRPDISFPALVPGIPRRVRESSNMFQTISHGDLLLHHPYQSFSPVIDLVRQAARDPEVLAIKQTLYRSNSSSEVVEALIEAARNGKEVTAVVELRARFDEEDNLHFAARLQEAGAVVVYGVLTHKTHAKMLLIVRKEGKKLRRYFHLGTGNYHSGNARIYTDYSLLSSDEQVGNDVHKVFHQLTGMGKEIKPQYLFHAPFTLQKRLLGLINAETEAAKKGEAARVILKCNGLTERKTIMALYEASCAGVKVDLLVRGMCCLRPGIPGVSENIRVVSIVGRFLEHSRVYFFKNAEQRIFASSADLMDRNLLRRVEVCFPILSTKLADRVKKELEVLLLDTQNAWELQADGEYLHTEVEDPSMLFSAQNMLIDKYAQ